MATEEDYFTDAVDEARKIEKKALKYKSYEGDIEIRKDIDLYPSEYVDIDYRDLLNLYERAEKIITAKKMKIYAPGAKPGVEIAAPEKKKPISAQEAKKIEEVESRLKDITSEALRKAQEIAEVGRPPEERGAPPEKAKPPPHLEIELERERPPPEEVPSELELEFEKPPEREIRKEERPPPQISIEPKVPEEIEEKKPEEEKLVAEEAEVLMPQLLESPDEAAEKKYKRIEDEVVSTLGEKADEKSIKKKMLELTKQLFKEKSFDRREDIKHEIAALKNMLSARKEKVVRKVTAKAKKARKAPEEEIAHLQVLQTLISTQSSELAQTKDSITSSYKHKIDSLKDKFYEDSATTEDPDKKKKLYDNLVFELTKLSEQLPATIGKFKDYTTKKHLAEIRKIRERVGSKEKDADEQIDERMNTIETKYANEFDVLQDLLSKRIEGVIRTASLEVFEKKPEAERTEVEEEEAKVDEIISEISNLDVGTLLYYLHSKDPDYYKKYERKHVSRTEALAKARALMAKEKGLNADTIRKYFGDVEG